MHVFHAVAFGGLAPDRRFSVKSASDKTAIVVARGNAALQGFPHVFVEDADGRRIYQGATTDCRIFFSESDPDGDPDRDPSGGWFYQAHGSRTASGPFHSQFAAIQEAVRP